MGWRQEEKSHYWQQRYNLFVLVSTGKGARSAISSYIRPNTLISISVAHSSQHAPSSLTGSTWSWWYWISALLTMHSIWDSPRVAIGHEQCNLQPWTAHWLSIIVSLEILQLVPSWVLPQHSNQWWVPWAPTHNWGTPSDGQDYYPASSSYKIYKLGHINGFEQYGQLPCIKIDIVESSHLSRHLQNLAACVHCGVLLDLTETSGLIMLLYSSVYPHGPWFALI